MIKQDQRVSESQHISKGTKPLIGYIVILVAYISYTGRVASLLGTRCTKDGCSWAH